ncbi:glutamate carboxypeptidase 2-like isoform X2 [Dreissena polymorpha]|uniref:glutamate carboxypeptidase 2-like isoform X2 n=1 Tax=Dreissena polymorpha TaxID=45954 RepID=UPI002263BE9A|nr:glutamate carboxypeptidase 2-like isoform X2 [Dreissena polymorpha]
MYDIHSSDDDAYLARRRPRDTRCLIIATIAAVIVAFVIGILIGRFAACPEPEVGNDVTGGFPESANYSWMKDGDPTISRLLIDGMKAENIRSNLKMLTEKPHLSGTEQNHELGRKLTEFWTEVGLDHVTLTPYKVQLSYPNETSLSYVELLDGNGNSVYKSNLTEPVLTPEENKPDVVPPFNAYSPPGNITGEIVYLNYGRVEDHLYLERNTSLTVKGKIVLVRYGKIFRGDKVRQAEKRGAIGVILFSDPDDITSGIVDKVYPDDWWLPPSGAQRGSIYLGVGDPLTPGYPAIESAYRKKDPDEYMPGIPCHPVGYGIAVKIMEALAGIEVPIDWRGKMNVTYKFGGSFNTNGWKAHIFVSTAPKMVTTYNAFGIIRGAVEPDRYVLVGNHRDAWVFGALDPSSGTAAMMEMSRVMGNLLKSGKWRPRRSIVFCSWGAEEYGLVGSIEWVEKKMKLSAYPMYHSVYETFYLVDKIMDIGFKYHTALGQLWVEMTRQLADDVILPLNVSDMVSLIKDQTDNLLTRFGQLMENNGTDTAVLRSAVQNLTNTVYEFVKAVSSVDKKDPYAVRRVNDQLMNVERAFIDPNGLPGRKYKHHLLFTESNVNSYAGSSYPGLSDALTNIEQGENVTEQWEVVHRHFAVVVFTLQSAQSVLKNVTDFMFTY